MNSEVWDVRTLSLLRSCPALDGAAVTFAGGDVLFAIQRPISDDLRARCPFSTPGGGCVVLVFLIDLCFQGSSTPCLSVTSSPAGFRHEQTRVCT